MREVLVLLVFGLLVFDGFGQQKLKPNIYVYKGNFGATRIKIGADSENKFTSVIINQKKVAKINDLLAKVKNRFKHWQEIAIRDSVEYVKKEFHRDYLFYADVDWSNGGEVWGNSAVMMIPYFIVENGKGWLSIRAYRNITASMNRFIVLRDFSWNFYSVAEIDAFIEATQEENIKKLLIKGAYENSLFK